MVDSLPKGSSCVSCRLASHRQTLPSPGRQRRAPRGATQLTRTRLLAAVGVRSLTTLQRDCLTRHSRRRMEFAFPHLTWQDGLLPTHVKRSLSSPTRSANCAISVAGYPKSKRSASGIAANCIVRLGRTSSISNCSLAFDFSKTPSRAFDYGLIIDEQWCFETNELMGFGPIGERRLTSRINALGQVELGSASTESDRCSEPGAHLIHALRSPSRVRAQHPHLGPPLYCITNRIVSEVLSWSLMRWCWSSCS